MRTRIFDTYLSHEETLNFTKLSAHQETIFSKDNCDIFSEKLSACLSTTTTTSQFKALGFKQGDLIIFEDNMSRDGLRPT